MSTNPQIKSIPKRPPEQVMRLERMGCFHQTRLSFMRGLLRQLKQDQWSFTQTQWEVDAKGVGVAVYQATGPDNVYSLVCFAHDLPADKRSDRVIADQWDATFALYDGIPSEADIARMADNVPYQEAGQVSEKELVLSRANRSVRLFAHVVERLSNGQQPDKELIDQIGYLMRTTAVYGNGKFGLGDRERIANRPEFFASFRTELLAVWLIRWFTIDIVEHMAKSANPAAVPLDLTLKTRLGVGNSTGLGMAPFLVTHPALLHTWIDVRETALMRVRNLASVTTAQQTFFIQLVQRMQLIMDRWNTANERQQEQIKNLNADIESLNAVLQSEILKSNQPFNALIEWSEKALTVAGQELVVSLAIEPFGELVDDLAEEMYIDESQFQSIKGGQTVSQLLETAKANYDWALARDYQSEKESARFWYVSEEKLEPRLGQRYQEPGAEKEQPLAFARDVAKLCLQLKKEDGQQRVTEFLMRYPCHRSAVRRLQLVDQLPYAEIRDNLISDNMVPVDLLRCKLSFFGANKFDPRSDRWVRITMFQNAPYPDSFIGADADDWAFPPLSASAN